MILMFHKDEKGTIVVNLVSIQVSLHNLSNCPSLDMNTWLSWEGSHSFNPTKIGR
jgi:hypothetical protein